MDKMAVPRGQRGVEGSKERDYLSGLKIKVA